MVVHKNYVVVYAEKAETVSILRVLHVARSWPPRGAWSYRRPFSKSGKNTASTPINGKYAHSEYT